MKLLLLELVTKSVLIFMLLHLLYSFILKMAFTWVPPAIKYTCCGPGCTESDRITYVHQYRKSLGSVDFLIQKIIIWNLAKGTMDSAGPQDGAVRQVAGRLACRRTHDHTKTFYRAVLR